MCLIRFEPAKSPPLVICWIQINAEWLFNLLFASFKKLITSPLWQNQFTFFYPTKKVRPSWFGLPVLINKKYLTKKKNFLNFLNSRGIETRKIISGNFMNQTSIDLYNLNPNNKTFNNAQEIEDRGFFIGLHTKPISEKTLNYLEKNLLILGKL